MGLSLFENRNYDEALEKFTMASDIDESKATYFSNKGIFQYFYIIINLYSFSFISFRGISYIIRAKQSSYLKGS